MPTVPNLVQGSRQHLNEHTQPSSSPLTYTVLPREHDIPRGFPAKFRQSRGSQSLGQRFVHGIAALAGWSSPLRLQLLLGSGAPGNGSDGGGGGGIGQLIETPPISRHVPLPHLQQGFVSRGLTPSRPTIRTPLPSCVFGVGVCLCSFDTETCHTHNV